MKKSAILILGGVMCLSGCGSGEKKVQFTLASFSFKDNQSLPVIHAQVGFAPDALNKEPHLTWSGAPAQTKSFAVIAEDPDAVGGTFVHWVVYNIPHTIREISATKKSGVEGVNDDGKPGYYGPYPPVNTGMHHYYFAVYALDTMLNLEPGATAAEVREAMEGHVLAQDRLIGLVTAPSR
jgi:Raf kinase inhibitor-like YbhB/YbcL family protein